MLEGAIQGRIQGLIDVILLNLEELGTLSETIKIRIENETDIGKLQQWTKLAVVSESIGEFKRKM